MTRSQLRFACAGFLVASVAWAVSFAQPGKPAIGIAQPPGKGKADDKKDDRPPEDDFLPFGFPYERVAKDRLKGARDYLEYKDIKNIPWSDVCGFLQGILDSRSDSFFNVLYTAGGTKQINRISVKTEANRIIAVFPKEGLEFYRQAYGGSASAMLDDAIKANYDLAMLADLSQRYFHTKAGGEGTVLLGTIYLERGNFLEAAHAFERVLTRPAGEDLATARTLFKACLAFKRSGDPRLSELYKTTLAALAKATSKDGLQLGRKLYTFDQLVAEIERPVDLIRVTSTVGEWAMRGGNPGRAGTIDGGPPFLDPTFRSTMFYTGDDEANSWIKTELERLFSRDGKIKGVPLPAFFPVTTSDMVVFRAYNGVYGVATRDQVVNGRVVRAGDIRWVSKTTFGTHQLLSTGESDDIDMKKDAQNWWATYSRTGVTSVLYENPLVGTLTHDGQNVYFVDDIALPPPPVYAAPEFGIPGQPQYRQNGDLADAVRAGRLVAVDIKSGAVKWDLGRAKVFDGAPPLPPRLNEDEADKTTSAFQLCLDAVFLGPPLPLHGKLYVLVEQAGAIRLLCLDPKNLVAVPGQTRKPALVWSQKLGKPNSTLPQDSVRRYQGATIAAGEGILICPTNSGAVVAVDIMSRSLLWAHAYRKLDANSGPRRPTFDPNTGQPIIPNQLPVDRWRAGGPIVSGGRVILTAYDSNLLECLDLRTGKLLWKAPRDPNDLYVGGVVNDKVIVVGRNQIRAYHLAGESEQQEPKVAFAPVTIPTPTGHGVGGKGVFYVPVRQDNAGKDASTPPAEIWAVNVETGQVTSKTASRKRNDTAELSRYGIGNLVFQDGMVFAQSAWELACYPQLEQKKAEMDRLLKANPKDPVGLLARGELLLDDGKLKDAIADFKDAQKNNLPMEKQPLLREKLYVAYTELIRNDFAAGEPVLDEYAALCEIPLDGVDPEEKVRRMDETLRRKRLYLYLLARGREGQNRLGEAFDQYLALANLGEGKSLLEMPDEPNVRMRPDVWARGRIEGMIRKATDPVARKSLEERVGKEWDQVKAGTDLKRLREFVAVFGPYFASGADAKLLLADKLLQTNNEADAREAQTHLAQLRAAADDPAVRARATAALAELMVKNQLMEDAVGLYLQLGREYPNVVIKDGKTGADYVTGLLTDRRLLPYLEPSRFPMPSRVKAEQMPGNPGGNMGAQFEIEPGGELFPMYKRYRFVIDQYISGNGSWTVRALDRATGAEKARFSGLVQPQIYNPGSMPFSKFVQASGQMLLVQLGANVYLLDLAEKRVRGDRNLLGDPTPGANPNPPIQEPGPDGDVVVRYAEGFTLTLGKSAVLQPGYVALLTRDGLEVVDPSDLKTKLWTRRGIAERTQLYGDARYIVLVETGSDRKPVSARILRAVDGMAVDGSPDSGRVLAGAKSYQILGRTALIAEGTGDQPRVLRLYDLTTGKDVWKKEYDPKAVPIRGLTAEFTGFVKSDGEAEVIRTHTGEVVGKLKIDPKNLDADLKPAVEAQLLVDADRFYLVLERDPSQPSTNNTQRVPVYNNSLRVHKVNGPLYAFDRATGKRLWSYGNGLLENQYLVLEQFAESPVVIAAAPMINRNNPNNPNQYTYQVVVIEKARGKLIFDRPVQYNGNFFQNMTVNQKNGTIDLNRFDVRISITPDDSPKPTGP